MNKPMTVIIAVDSSTFSSEILRIATARAWERGTRFIVFTAVEPSLDYEATQQFVHSCRLILDDRVDRLKEKFPHCEVMGECEVGHAGTLIVEAAREHNADMIVIGSHGDTGVRSPHIGSVAAEVVNRAPCSVAVIKLKKHPIEAAKNGSSHTAVKH